MEMDTESRSGGNIKERELAIMHEYFEEHNSVDKEIRIEECEIDFGATSRTKLADKKMVHVTNNTNGKVVVCWKVPGSDDLDAASKLSFTVYPPTQDISPGKSVAFQVSFRPNLDNQYYCEEIEAYVYMKKNRNFRLTNEESFTPPWCITFKAKGHTFIKSGEFLPKVTVALRKNMLIMPPCHLGDATYNTFYLNNESDTPASFEFANDPSGIFKVKPRIGLIQGNRSQIVAVEYRPKKVGIHAYNLACGLNNSAGDTQNISVFGAAYTPKIEIENNGMLYFKPTCTGIKSM
jgi:hypothetical protein